MHYLETFIKIKSYVLDCLFPLFCYGCSKDGEILCKDCRRVCVKLPPTCFVCKKIVSIQAHYIGKTCKPCRKKSAIFAYFSPFSYENTLICKLIHDLKYKRTYMLAPVLADLLYDSLRYFKVELPKSAVVIPIPLHKTRLRSRGFNQSELIANILATKLGLSYKPEILIKIKKTLPQVGLLGEERRKNIAGTFGIHNQETIYGKNVILFDDVKTTGTTLEESARLIRSSGARKIWAITLAH